MRVFGAFVLTAALGIVCAEESVESVESVEKVQSLTPAATLIEKLLGDGEFDADQAREMSSAYEFYSDHLPADVKADLAKTSVEDERCEVCQIAVHVITDLMKEHSKTASTKKGSLDIVLQDILDGSEVCSNATWMGMDAKCGISLDRLVASCKTFVTDMGEIIEDVVPTNFRKESDARAKICSQEATVCKASEIWTAENDLENRPDKATVNKKVSDAFREYLSDEKTGLADLVTTDSGLAYKLFPAPDADAEKPHKDDTVSVHYIGTQVDGSIFDASFERGEPASFGVGQVIAGWQEGLQKISVGQWATMSIPPHLGYGSEGTHRIAGNEHLLFHVKLISITHPSRPTADSDTQDEDSMDDLNAMDDDEPTLDFPTLDGSGSQDPDEEL